MKNIRAEMLSQRPPLVGRRGSDRTYPFPNSQLTDVHLKVLADWDSIETRSKKSKAFKLGMSVEQYDEAMMRAEQQRLEAEKVSAARDPEKKLRKI